MTTGGTKWDYRRRLLFFYERHDPSKTIKIDELLRLYAGREDELMAKEVSKYGPEPPMDPSVLCLVELEDLTFIERALRLVNKYDPAQNDVVEKLAQSIGPSDERKFYEKQLARYKQAEEPPLTIDEQESLREQITAGQRSAGASKQKVKQQAAASVSSDSYQKVSSPKKSSMEEDDMNGSSSEKANGCPCGACVLQ